MGLAGLGGETGVVLARGRGNEAPKKRPGRVVLGGRKGRLLL